MSQIIKISFNSDQQVLNFVPGVVYPPQEVLITFAQQGAKGDPGDSAAAVLAVATKTANYTMLTTDAVIKVDASAGPVTITAPAPALSTGRLFTVKKIDSSSNFVTVSPASGLIEGGASAVIKRQWAAIDFVSDGTTYSIK